MDGTGLAACSSVLLRINHLRRVSCHIGGELFCAAQQILAALLVTLLKVSPLLKRGFAHLTLLAAAHVCQGHMLVCVAADTLGKQHSLPEIRHEAKQVVGLVSGQAIIP